MKITGGQRAGNNLFYSFEKFSIPIGSEAIFENAVDVENIFALITGGNTSSFNGILKVQGEANFFLVNPNGIVFEENARLDVDGSFIATTASSIQFQDGAELIASDLNSAPLSNASFPIGLEFSSSSGSGTITVNGNGNQIKKDSPLTSIEFEQTPEGLSVTSSQTLSLVGDGLSFNGGVVTTKGGQVHLSSLKSGSVSLKQTENGLTLRGFAGNEYQDLDFNQQSLIYADGEQAAIISLTGKNINLLDGSFVLSQNQGNSEAGLLKLNATETLVLSGQVSNVRSNIRSETFKGGKGANIDISAGKTLLENGARIRSNSFGDSSGGDIKLEISDSIQMFNSSIIATTLATGNAGNINLSTSQLQLNTAGVSSSTFGYGHGGVLRVDADLIEIIGTDSTDRASIATTAWATGDAGNLLLNAGQLRVIDGASLSSSSFSHGNAGDLVLNVSQSIEVKGTGHDGYRTSNNSQSIIRSAVQSVPKRARKALSLPDVPSGDSGNLTITAPVLKIIEEGVVSVENQGTGNSGLLSINVEKLYMRAAGSITAANATGSDGKIALNISDWQIDDSSRITPEGQNH